MPYLKNGKGTSRRNNACVENITRWGIWLYVRGKEYYLDYENYPWFRDARVADIHDVRLVRGSYLRWPALDVDLELECLAHPERYPLVFR